MSASSEHLAMGKEQSPNPEGQGHPSQMWQLLTSRIRHIQDEIYFSSSLNFS
jgi:hypothetical protein